MSEFVKTSLRLPSDLMDRLKWACLKRKTNQTTAVITALEIWLGQHQVQNLPVRQETSPIQSAGADSMLTEIERRNPAVGRTLRAAIAAAAVELDIEDRDRDQAQDGLDDNLDRIAAGVGEITAIADRAGGSSGKNRGRTGRKTAG